MVAAAAVVGLAACGGSSSDDSVASLAPSTSATTAPSVTTTTTPAATATSTVPSTVATTVASTTTLPPTTAAPPIPGHTSCQAVAHLGDSTSVGLISPSFIANPADRMGGQYTRVGAADVRLEISGARSIVETLPGQVNAFDTARALKASGFDGCWVFALGTTDTANVAVGSNTDRTTRIDRMMSVVGDDPVLWVKVKTLVTQGAWSNMQMAAWNDALAAAQARYPNLRLYDWPAVVQDQWFASDRIHYTSAGYTQRARLIADALATAYPG